jgi:hypothetical protein
MFGASSERVGRSWGHCLRLALMLPAWVSVISLLCSGILGYGLLRVRGTLLVATGYLYSEKMRWKQLSVGLLHLTFIQGECLILGGWINHGKYAGFILKMEALTSTNGDIYGDEGMVAIQF